MEINVIKAKIFKSNQSQAVRLSKVVAFPVGVREVRVVIVGDSRVVTRVNKTCDSWFESPTASDGYMLEREQLEVQIRESFGEC